MRWTRAANPGLFAVPAVVLLGACGGPSFVDEVPALAQPQITQDRLRSGSGDSTAVAEISADSTRYLGGTQVPEYWVGVDGDRICLVQSVRGTSALTSACADAEEFRRSGVPVATTDGSPSATALLVPAGFDPADAAGEEHWVSVSDNLLAPAGAGESSVTSR